MKNIIIFQPLVIISLVLCLGILSSPPALWGQGEDKTETGDFPYIFSVSPLAGFLYGRGEEIVYKSEKSGAYQSELLWDIKPLVYSGAVLDVFRKKSPAFFYSISLKFGFPMGTGFMEDRDWLAWNGELSHYSRHDSKAGEAWFHDFLGGISLPFGSRVLFKPFLGLSYTHLKWIASDGYTKYGKDLGGNTYLPLEDSDRETPQAGRIVSYTQEWLVLLFGASLSYVFHPRFSATLSLRLSPFLYFTGVDEHHLKKMEYDDYIWGGFYLEPGGEALFSFNKRLSMGLYISWRYMKGSPHGLSYSRGNNQTYERYLAGAAWQTLDSGLRLILSF
ncbi:MAG: omptin family outer membrane protease [Treponema sp.]|jgi:outer membrane protease|nr:omptin family outer membrane protease [Treponema sp.]